MKRLTGLMVAVVPLAGLLVTAVPRYLRFGGAPGGAPNWQSLEQTALQTAGNAQGGESLNLAGLPSVPAQSTVTTPSGPVSLSQQTVVTNGQTGTLVVNMALLGGSQLIVTEMNPAQNYQGETMVLAPGSSTVTGTYRLSGAHPQALGQAALQSLRKGRGKGFGLTASDAVAHATSGKHSAVLTAVGGCWAYPGNPGVIQSVYGPLIQGTGVIDCTSQAETLSMIVGLYRTSYSGWTAGGSGWGYLGVNVYAPCYQSNRAWAWQTSELWAVNGVLQGGADSGMSLYGCT